jgi:hypothetical protein
MSRVRSATRDGGEDYEGFFPGSDFVGQRSVGRFVGEILLANEKAQEGTALQGDVVTDGSTQHGVAGFEGVEDGPLRDWSGDFEFNLARDVGQGAQVGR